jgi:hypothetical protein
MKVVRGRWGQRSIWDLSTDAAGRETYSSIDWEIYIVNHYLFFSSFNHNEKKGWRKAEFLWGNINFIQLCP